MNLKDSINLFLENTIPVILLQPGSKNPISKNGGQWILNSPDEVPSALGRFNLGIMCGWQKNSPIIVVGVDTYKPGWEKTAQWVKDMGVNTKENVWVIKTGRGGIAVCYYYNHQLDLKRQAGLMRGTLDLLTNGFQLVPPSDTAKIQGGPYTWIKGHSPLDIPLSDLSSPPDALMSFWQDQDDHKVNGRIMTDEEVDKLTLAGW